MRRPAHDPSPGMSVDFWKRSTRGEGEGVAAVSVSLVLPISEARGWESANHGYRFFREDSGYCGRRPHGLHLVSVVVSFAV